MKRHVVKTLPSLLRQLSDRSTRRNALEKAFVAHALLNPEMLRPILAARCDGYRVGLSLAAADLLDVIAAEPGACIALVRWVLLASIDGGWSRARTIAAVALARAVVAVPLQELAALGSPDVVLSLLEAHGHEQRRERKTNAHTSRAA